MKDGRKYFENFVMRVRIRASRKRRKMDLGKLGDENWVIFVILANVRILPY